MPFYHDLKSYADDPVYPGKADWIARRLLALRYDLGQVIVKDRRPNSLIVGSWNIRAFDNGVPRLDESFHYIAEIISAFDICAIQEVKTSLAPLKRLVRLLGPNWDYFVTDVSDHEGGNAERMAFVYNTNKVIFRNLIGEIVVNRKALGSGGQIARSPFFAAFQAGWFRFTLVSSHIIFGKTTAAGLALRAQEVSAIAKAVTKRAKSEDQVYVFLGDMNIDSLEGPVMGALRESKLEVPKFPASNLKGDKFYDQIAFSVDGKTSRKTRLIRHGVFDWRNAVFGPFKPDPNAPDDPAQVARVQPVDILAHYAPIANWNRTTNPATPDHKEPYADFARSFDQWMTYEMSDHLPIWVELETDYSDAYLTRFTAP